MIKFSKSFRNFKFFIKFQIQSKLEPYVIKQLLHLNLINMRFYGAEYNTIELGFFASFNTVVLCSIKPHIDLVQVQYLYIIWFSNIFILDVPDNKIKNKNTTLSEQLQNPIAKSHKIIKRNAYGAINQTSTLYYYQRGDLMV